MENFDGVVYPFELKNYQRYILPVIFLLEKRKDILARIAVEPGVSGGTKSRTERRTERKSSCS